MRKIIGGNLRALRSMAGLTAEELSRAVADKTGADISPDAVLRYERGERSLRVEDAVILSIALDCSPQAIIDGTEPGHGGGKLSRKMHRLSQEEYQTFRTIATDFQGDRSALITAMGCLAAMPERRRLTAIMAIMEQLTASMAAGEVSPARLPSGLAHLEQRLGELLGGGSDGEA